MSVPSESGSFACGRIQLQSGISLPDAAPKMAGDASDRGDREFLVVPHVMQQIHMSDVLIGTTRQSIEQPESSRMAEMQ